MRWMQDPTKHTRQTRHICMCTYTHTHTHTPTKGEKDWSAIEEGKGIKAKNGKKMMEIFPERERKQEAPKSLFFFGRIHRLLLLILTWNRREQKRKRSPPKKNKNRLTRTRDVWCGQSLSRLRKRIKVRGFPSKHLFYRAFQVPLKI